MVYETRSAPLVLKTIVLNFTLKPKTTWSITMLQMLVFSFLSLVIALVSATPIDATPNAVPQQSSPDFVTPGTSPPVPTQTTLSRGAIAGIVIGTIVGGLAISAAVLLVYYLYRRREERMFRHSE